MTCQDAPFADSVLCSIVKQQHSDNKNTTETEAAWLHDLANVLSLAQPMAMDGVAACHYLMPDLCLHPDLPVNDFINRLLPPPPPNTAQDEAPVPGNNGTFTVLHVSDINLQHGYTVNSEGNCNGYICCTNSSSEYDQKVNNFGPMEAGKYGYYRCDMPRALLQDALMDIAAMNNTLGLAPKFALFTGGLTENNPMHVSASDWASEREDVLAMLHDKLGGMPVYPAVGIHDVSAAGQLAQNASGMYSTNNNGTPFQQQVDALTAAWQSNGWVGQNQNQNQTRYYGSYATSPIPGLKIVSLNSNFWSRWNLYNYWDTARNLDTSGQLQFLIDELAHSERNHERVWIMAHMPPGTVANQSMPWTTGLFKQVVGRFAPRTVAALFFGQVRQDRFTVMYTGSTATAHVNATVDNAMAAVYMAPSLSPWWNLNPGWRYYTVDSKTFDVMDVTAFYTPLNATFPPAASTPRPPWQQLYSARAFYKNVVDWPAAAPLNATFWHHVAQAVHANTTVADQYLGVAWKNALYRPVCHDEACRNELYCSMVGFTHDQVTQCQRSFGLSESKLEGGPPVSPWY